jgi:hypothetical protein
VVTAVAGLPPMPSVRRWLAMTPLDTALHLKADRVRTTDAGWPRVDVTVELVGRRV